MSVCVCVAGSGRDQRSETEALRQKRKQKLMDVDRKQQYLQVCSYIDTLFFAKV